MPRPGPSGDTVGDKMNLLPFTVYKRMGMPEMGPKEVMETPPRRRSSTMGQVVMIYSSPEDEATCNVQKRKREATPESDLESDKKELELLVRDLVRNSQGLKDVLRKETNISEGIRRFSNEISSGAEELQARQDQFLTACKRGKRKKKGKETLFFEKGVQCGRPTVDHGTQSEECELAHHLTEGDAPLPRTVTRPKKVHGNVVKYQRAIEEVSKLIQNLRIIVDENQNTKRELKYGVADLEDAFGTLQDLEETVLTALADDRSRQRRRRTLSEPADLEEDLRVGVLRKVCGERVSSLEEGPAMQGTLLPIEKPVMADAWTQTGSVPLVISGERSFACFRSLATMDWDEEEYKTVQMKETLPFGVYRDGSTVIIRSRRMRESGPLMNMVHFRYPEYVAVAGQDGETIEEGITSICSEVALVRGEEVNKAYNHIIIVTGEEVKKGSGSLEHTYEGLIDLKNMVNKAGLKRLAIASDLVRREAYLRKMIEYIFRGEKMEITLCVPTLKRSGLTEKPKAVVPTKKKEQSRSAALILKQEGKSYETLLQEVRTHLEGVECNIRSARQTKNGGLLLTMAKGEEDDGKLKNVLSSKIAGLKISHGNGNGGSRTLHVKDLDAVTTKEEVLKAVSAFLGEKYTEGKVRVTSLRQAFGSCKAATLQTEPEVADALLKQGRIKVGLIHCRIREREETLYCYRCWESGHMAKQCHGADRSSLCRRCGKTGHTAKECKGTIFCPICQVVGHRARTPMCESLQKKATRAENKKPP